ncbi:hypothetical protein YC2023_106853 [Brassica napus]
MFCGKRGHEGSSIQVSVTLQHLTTYHMRKASGDSIEPIYGSLDGIELEQAMELTIELDVEDNMKNT